ncbi:2-oxoglutarate dehydrogenase, E2 component, dihydrolipoamide succinyltransferase [Actinocatenispora sera]|uniref:2-oxoglutarate dehydrogenase, E2 component, dihydrolipoamide succinyltransferase n=1 Tax=Actinocatenispora sera TaxID=390989 RepID=UPI0033F7B79A
MPTSVTMPQLGESVTEGTVTRWLKQEGDRVEVDEPLLEVSTDKVDTEIPSPAAGVLSRIVVPEDETVDVGAELAQISGDGESAPAQPAAEPQQAPSEQPAPEAAQPAAPEQSPEPAQPAAAPAQPEQPAAAPAPTGGAAEGTEVAMPALGESVTEGTVTRWLKQVGESVEVDEPLLEVSTDKVDTEIPSPAAGTVLDIKVQEDETVDVGTVLAIVGSGSPSAAPSQPAPSQPAPSQPAPSQPAPSQPAPSEPAGQPAAATPAPAQPVAPSQPVQRAQTAEPVQQTAPAASPQVEQPASTGQQPSGDGPSGYVTPLVRKLAAEHDIDLGSLSGTGVGGRIRKQDVLDAAEAKKQAAAKPAAPAAASAPAAPTAAPSPLRGRTEKLPRMRQVIAKRMVESLQTAAQLTTVIEVDVTRIAQLRARAKDEFLARHGVKLTFLPFFAMAAVEALREHPKLNASIDTEQKTVTYHDTENLAIAVDTNRGLIVPVIHNAGDLNLAGLARHIADLAGRTRDNTVSPDDLAGGTFTLTNTGSVGVLFDTPIFPQPQVAMLGAGAVVKRAVVVDDANLGEIIVPRSMVYLSLSYDHRLVDGADAARYLATVKERLEAGDFESSLGL